MTTRNVHVGVYDTQSDWEIGHVMAHVNKSLGQRQPGSVRIVTVGPSHDPVTSMGGLHIVPDMALEELRPEDSAMLILPGADLWDEGGNTDFAGKAREFLDAGVPVAAICGATAGLAREGLLDDRRHTSNAAMYLEMTGYAGGPLYHDDLVVTDRNLITANATAPVEFAREILARLDVFDPPVLESWYRLYGQHDPAGYFELMEAAAG